MADVHKPVHAGTRWALIHGSYEAVERFAVNELQRTLQRHLPYVMEVRPGADEAARRERHLVLTGTAGANPLLGELVSRGLLRAPEGVGGYSLAVMDSPWGAGRKLLAVCGSDPAGVLHGVVDFSARVLTARVAPDDPRELRRALDEMAPLTLSEGPAVANRGLWTWGYVVYDYRRYIDNMARLKMNMLCLWNDCAPENAAEIVAYAHSRGIKVVWGFHWGWGIEGLDLADREHRRLTREQVLRTYREEYAGLGGDGIYFQTATEHKQLELGGRSVASLACDWVNDIAGALLDVDPGLYIQFGLHAISIGEHCRDLASLDPRVSLVWEDAGAVPYSYDPAEDFAATPWYVPPELNTAAKTLEYSRRLAALRPGAEFGMVAKGWMKLRWGVDFEHHGRFVLGERDRAWIRRRLEERRPGWDRVNRQWLRGFPAAARFYRETLDCRPAGMTVLGLVEDGMFEEEIQPSVALFAETLWNPRRPDAELLDLAMSPYYREARS
ncbi:MAG TPA: hypothetical protein PK280_08885 [Planctomycetota bacterium]|nr:hypothetical protein [Planctomycetota bacterium]